MTRVTSIPVAVTVPGPLRTAVIGVFVAFGIVWLISVIVSIVSRTPPPDARKSLRARLVLFCKAIAFWSP